MFLYFNGIVQILPDQANVKQMKKFLESEGIKISPEKNMDLLILESMRAYYQEQYRTFPKQVQRDFEKKIKEAKKGKGSTELLFFIFERSDSTWNYSKFYAEIIIYEFMNDLFALKKVVKAIDYQDSIMDAHALPDMKKKLVNDSIQILFIGKNTEHSPRVKKIDEKKAVNAWVAGNKNVYALRETIHNYFRTNEPIISDFQLPLRGKVKSDNELQLLSFYTIHYINQYITVQKKDSGEFKLIINKTH
jgi:hypothetical protein